MKTLNLTNSKLVTQVDDDIWEKYKDSLIYLKREKTCRTRYATVYFGNKTLIPLHRLILQVPDGYVIDHRDGDGLNNQRHNLRPATYSQNLSNQNKRRGQWGSKFKGVAFFKRDRCWRAYVTLNGKQKHLGYFRTEIEAAIKFNQEAPKYYGEFARLNEIEQIQ